MPLHPCEYEGNVLQLFSWFLARVFHGLFLSPILIRSLSLLNNTIHCSHFDIICTMTNERITSKTIKVTTSATFCIYDISRRMLCFWRSSPSVLFIASTTLVEKNHETVHSYFLHLCHPTSVENCCFSWHSTSVLFHWLFSHAGSSGISQWKSFLFKVKHSWASRRDLQYPLVKAVALYCRNSSTLICYIGSPNCCFPWSQPAVLSLASTWSEAEFRFWCKNGKEVSLQHLKLCHKKWAKQNKKAASGHSTTSSSPFCALTISVFVSNTWHTNY